MAKNYISNKDESVRMFKSNFLELFSKVHFTVPLYVFIPVVAYFLYESFFVRNFSISETTVWFIIGTFVWTFTEYFLHRFVFHFTPHGKWMEKIHFIFHGVHHDYPNDSKRLVMPPVVSIPLATIFFYLFTWLFDIYTSPLFAGFIIGYLFYDMTHYAVHHFNMHSKFWLAIKNHHVKHHFQDMNKGFGVSSPLWDYVMNTTFPEKTKKA